MCLVKRGDPPVEATPILTRSKSIQKADSKTSTTLTQERLEEIHQQQKLGSPEKEKESPVLEPQKRP